jgi:phosphoglycerol transferase MdoB-like AlkP superfamily enzyme
MKIYGEGDFPPDTPKAGWGYSDKALFDKALSEFTSAAKPFFATILTLSNHGPYKLPTDAPLEIQNSPGDMRTKLIRYVDSSTGEFFKAVKRDFPNTVFVFIADHGIFIGEGLMSQIPPYEVVRRVGRIPLIIHIPGQPASTKVTIDHLASNADLAPTLLALFGWEKTPQQFMGQNIFARQGPVYIDWMNKLLSVTPHQVIKVPDAEENALSAVLQLNLLAPATVTGH